MSISTSRLLSTCPGTTAGPLSPPRTSASALVTLKPPFGFSPL
jgi:hypothetical protein